MSSRSPTKRRRLAPKSQTWIDVTGDNVVCYECPAQTTSSDDCILMPDPTLAEDGTTPGSGVGTPPSATNARNESVVCFTHYDANPNEDHRVGIDNPGKNTCFANAALQLLSQLSDIIVCICIRSAQNKYELNTANRDVYETTILSELVPIFKSIRQAMAGRSECVPVAADKIQSLMIHVSKRRSMFVCGEQNDARELFAELCDLIDEEAKAQDRDRLENKEQVPNGETLGNPIRCFRFALELRRSCTGCNNVDSTKDRCTGLVVPFTEKPGGADALSVRQLLDDRFEDTEITKRCACGCNTWCLSERFFSLPRVLAIEIGRYTYNEKTVSKNRTGLQLDLEIWLRDVFDEEIRYVLRGVVCHQGPSPKEGHYFSLVYNDNDHAWYNANDSFVEQISEGDINTSKIQRIACMLLYERSRPGN